MPRPVRSSSSRSSDPSDPPSTGTGSTLNVLTAAFAGGAAVFSLLAIAWILFKRPSSSPTPPSHPSHTSPAPLPVAAPVNQPIAAAAPPASHSSSASSQSDAYPRKSRPNSPQPGERDTDSSSSLPKSSFADSLTPAKPKSVQIVSPDSDDESASAGRIDAILLTPPAKSHSSRLYADGGGSFSPGSLAIAAQQQFSASPRSPLENLARQRLSVNPISSAFNDRSPLSPISPLNPPEPVRTAAGERSTRSSAGSGISIGTLSAADLVSPSSFNTVPSDSQLATYLLQSIETLQKSQSLTGVLEQNLSAWLYVADATRLSPQTRLFAAQWLILYVTVDALRSKSQSEYDIASERSIPAMNHAWNLLDCDSHFSTAELNAADLLRLDISQRLKDGERMLPIFRRVTQRVDMANEELIVAYTAAPLLGCWNATRELGEQLRCNGVDLEQFHVSSLTDRSLPDYKILWDFSLEEAKYGDDEVRTLKWEEYMIKSFAIRLKGVRSNSTTRAAAVEKELDPQGKREWKTFPLFPHETLKRFGGFACMESKSSKPIPMWGPFRTNPRTQCSSLKLSGYSDMTLQFQLPTRQYERYTLQQNPIHRDDWEGEYELTQDSVRTEIGKKPKTTKVIIVFDMKLKLELKGSKK